MQKIILYSTLACHLCEIAEEIVSNRISGTDFLLTKVDIADDLELLKKYGVSIPVLYSEKISKELFWPFDNDCVDSFLANIGT
ncbi:MAG: hypothetical protein ACJA1S_001281 [Cellvibrionaceae bacterium]|jgi:hypothetical protein